ncbi:hypothetical protein R1sor_020035 [Riccia sorocarpa]|uniref:Uncharacterized protein n=1 Tax=Riccia sorocarpa TaxID=122646 RepID=A0ABD3IE69_9MARC
MIRTTPRGRDLARRKGERENDTAAAIGGSLNKVLQHQTVRICLSNVALICGAEDHNQSGGRWLCHVYVASGRKSSQHFTVGFLDRGFLAPVFGSSTCRTAWPQIRHGPQKVQFVGNGWLRAVAGCLMWPVPIIGLWEKPIYWMSHGTGAVLGMALFGLISPMMMYHAVKRTVAVSTSSTFRSGIPMHHRSVTDSAPSRKVGARRYTALDSHLSRLQWIYVLCNSPGVSGFGRSGKAYRVLYRGGNISGIIAAWSIAGVRKHR